MRARTPGVVLAAAVLVVALAACSSSDSSGASGSSDSSGSSAATADPSQAAEVAWSPCDGLSATEVSRLAGAPVTEQTGTVDAPRCTFVPVRSGGPAYDVSYLWFADGLDTALGSMGAIADQLRPVDVPGATAARIAGQGARLRGRRDRFRGDRRGPAQSVNAVQVAPYDEQRLVRSTTALLAALAREAPAPS